MKILLLNPPFMPRFSRPSRSPSVTKGATFYIPYYLAYACGVLDKNGFDVKLIDSVASEWDKNKTFEFVKSFQPDLVVVDTSTPSIYNDVEVASEIKKLLPSVHVSLVGTHPTRVPDETFSLSNNIDSICRFEYDYTILELARALQGKKSLNSVDGLSFRQNGKIIHNKDRFLIKNLDELPFVSEVYKKQFGKEGIKKYFYASLKHPQITILTSRGCPFGCSFCPIPFKQSYRERSPENVVEEFEYIKKELPYVKEVMLEDDTFPINKQRTIKICDMLIEKKINLSWSCNARVDMDFETLKKMKDAGCRLMCVGFESPTKEVLEKIHKKTTKEVQIEFMKNTKKLGMLVNGCVILGLPGDTKQTMRDTIEFSKELNPDTMQFYGPYAYPGTELWDWAKENDLLVSEDYSKLLTSKGEHLSNIRMSDMTVDEIFEMCNQALKEFYIRPRYIFMKLGQVIRNPDEAKRTFISGVQHGFFKKLILPSSSK